MHRHRKIRIVLILSAVITAACLLCSCRNGYRIYARGHATYLEQNGAVIDSSYRLNPGEPLRYAVVNDTIYRLESHVGTGGVGFIIIRVLPGEPFMGSKSKEFIGFSFITLEKLNTKIDKDGVCFVHKKSGKDRMKECFSFDSLTYTPIVEDSAP